ncbi:MAG: putative zinc protease YmxG [Candidatus Parcubacteria bacterium]|nr:MAG: putative zinc protease YmxG [Candidatus Parcubacteria bacterium]
MKKANLPKILKLNNNLSCLFYNSSELITTTVLVLVKTGTDYENKQLNGISHFIEHLFFKGTKNYPSPQALSLELDKIGADYNAFTSYEYTGYYIKTLSENLERAIYFMSEMLTNPIFDQSELEKERLVILEEINYHYDTPLNFIFDETLKLAYEDQPAGWSILGTKDTLFKINQDEIKKYFFNNYSAKNSLIVITGNFDFNKAKNYINKYFKNYNNKKPPAKFKFKESVLKPKVQVIQRQKIKQAHLVLFLKTKGLNFLNDRRLSLGLLTSILGYGFSSRMFRVLREELGITYYLKVSNDLYSDRGYIYIQSGSNLDKIYLTINKIINELIKIKNEKITLEEIEKSKSLLETSILTLVESSLSVALFYGLDYLLLNKILSPYNYLEKIKKLNEINLKKEINNWIKKENLVFSILSPQRLDKNKIFKIINNLS